ncbi:hypothetical protein HT031_003158 [Scenedesmus sp. PABB004]|nr:hypothetical protein HT031_003158 [Scenedesmus sp. PABB004]
MFGATSKPAAPRCGTICVTRHCPREMGGRAAWSIDQFVVAKKLGGGYASTVHLAICKATGTQVAIKVYHRCKLSQLNNYQVQREIRIHSCLDHKNVLALFAAFEDEVGVYLVSEYASRGDVFGELDRRGGSMTEADAVRQVIAPFLSALEYLHSLSIIHRDIKPENLLFTSTGVLKVADFGLSIDITQERPVTRVGTLDYMAPEVVVCPDKCHPSDHKEKTHLHYTYLVDAWAVGVLAYELTVGRAPFDAGHKRGTIENILHSQPRYPAWLSDSCRHFVSWSLTKDAAKRPGIQQLAEHPWVHTHVGVPAKAAPSARAVSFHNLALYTDPAGARGADGAGAGSARQKMGDGLPAPAGSCERALAELAEAGGGDEDEVFVSASGDAAPAPARAGAGAAKPALPGGAVAISAASGVSAGPAAPPAPANSAASAQPAASPFAAAAAAAPAPSGGSGLMSLPVLGAAADKLRAFVHRCQSANDIDSLRAFMLLQPPEPSNACFEPGGRFHAGGAGDGAAAAAAAAGAAAQPGGAGAEKQQHGGMSAHDSAASLGSHGSSSSSSRPADLPRSPGAGAAAGGASPRPLALVRLPPALGGAVPRSDSCRSLQGLAGITEGKREGHESSQGGGPAPMSPGRTASLQGAASSSPMCLSPAAGPSRKAGPASASASTSSCSCSCSSSCESGLAASGRGSMNSTTSWDCQHQQQQQRFGGSGQAGQQPHEAPQPPSPPRLGAKAGAAAAQGLDQLLATCRPGQAVPVGAGADALTADGRAGAPGAAEAAAQAQLLRSLEHTNGCFGFLSKPPRR